MRRIDSADAVAPVAIGPTPLELPVILSEAEHEELMTENATRHDWIAEEGRQQREVHGLYQRTSDFKVSTTDSPKGFSKLWLGPATKASNDIVMPQVTLFMRFSPLGDHLNSLIVPPSESIGRCDCSGDVTHALWHSIAQRIVAAHHPKRMICYILVELGASRSPRTSIVSRNDCTVSAEHE